MKHRLVLLALALGLVAAACGTDTAADGDDPTTTTPPAGSGAPIDGEWVLISADVDGPLTLLPDWDVTMQIDGLTIGGRAACNSYGGKVSSDGSMFGVGEIAMTEMGCNPEVHAIESAFLDGLLRSTAVDRVDDELTLRGQDVTLTFALVPPVEPAELIGTTWVLDTIIQGEAATSIDARADVATMLFNDDGTFVGSTGCRTVSGQYVLDGAFVQFTSFSADGECPSELQHQDNSVISVLESFKAEIDGDRLTLSSPGGEGLSYRAEG